MIRTIIYHSINDDENKIYIDLHEIKKEMIKLMKKKYPKYDIEIVEAS